MKRIILLIVLIIINCVMLYTKIESSGIQKIDLELERDELGIVFFDDLLLFNINDKNIIYLLEAPDDLKIKFKINPFTKNVNYIIMNKKYKTKLSNKLIIEDKIDLESINFIYDDYLQVIYKDYKLCVNAAEINDCDFLFYTVNKKFFINENTKVIFYTNSVKKEYIDNTYNKWLDYYKVENSMYNVMKLNNFYEVIEIVK